jgi:hypothetical protein
VRNSFNRRRAMGRLGIEQPPGSGHMEALHEGRGQPGSPSPRDHPPAVNRLPHRQPPVAHQQEGDRLCGNMHVRPGSESRSTISRPATNDRRCGAMPRIRTSNVAVSVLVRSGLTHPGRIGVSRQGP